MVTRDSGGLGNNQWKTPEFFSGVDPVLDSVAGVLLEGYEVLIEDDRIKEVSDKPIRADNAVVIDLRRRVLMPGLIDVHVHLYLSELDLTRLKEIPVTLAAAQAGPILEL